jgi:hypothetical protein
MRQPPSGKAVTNEREYPYIVELVFDNDILDVELSRRILDFHRSRKIQPRHGRRIVREGQFFFRWCFSDSDTASAFTQRFGGEVAQPVRQRRSRPVRTSSSELVSDVHIFDNGEVVQLLRAAIKREGNQGAFAKRHGLGRSYLNMVLNGKRPVSSNIVKALGLRRVYAKNQDSRQ